mgnify:CR=1 FL=1
MELGLEIRRRSPFPVAFVASLTNGYCGYVPTEEAFEQQGYETHRTVYTSRLEKGAGRRIVEASVEAMERVHAICGRDAGPGSSTLRERRDALDRSGDGPFVLPSRTWAIAPEEKD